MLLAEKPLIQWTIEAGLNSLVIDHVIVSTDDIEIADVAHACGADVPFMRPAELGADNSNSYVVLEHAYRTLKELGQDYTYIAMLQPTSPFRTARHIDDAANLLEEKDADGVIGVTEIGHPLQWCNTLPESLEMDGFINVSDANSPSQKFEKSYCLNGAIYITSIDRMLKENSHVYGSSMFAFIMDRRDSIDIDSAFDFEMANFFMRK
jgi:CMP-N-acetylneuraminic acid synthetase